MTSQTVTKLGDYFQIKHGYAFKGEFFADSGPYVLLTPGNFFDEGGFKHKGAKEKYYTGEVPDGFILAKDDLIVAMTEQAEGLLGSSALIPEGNMYLHNQRLGLITELDQEKVDKKYLYYLFNTRSVRDQIRATANGAKVRHTSPSRIYEVEAYFPSLLTQRRIASILSTYDDLIENNTRRIAILEEMARRLYEEWFLKFRFPGHEKVEFVETERGPIPSSWCLGDIGGVCRRLQSGSTPSRKKDEYWDGGTIDWYKTKELWDGFLFDSEEHVTEAAVSDRKARIFEPNIILMAIYGSPTVGRLGVTTRRSSCNQAALGFEPDEAKVGFWYLYYVLMSLRDEFNSKAQGAAQQNISKAKVEETRIVIPPLELQLRFEEVVSPVRKYVLNIQTKNANLRTQRDLLLPKLVSGQIDVSEIELPDTEEAAA